jgi:hypothetical protein
MQGPALSTPLNEDAAAKALGIKVSTLRFWRCKGQGPAFLRIGTGKRGKVGYLPEDLATFRNRCRVDPGKAQS